MEHPSHVGKYEIEQFLGGGMSQVYRARDSVLGRRVALKILSSAAAADLESKSRFLLEARTASNIKHENIISIYDFGEDQGRPFMVMEYLEGESLREAIKNGHMGDFTNQMKIALQVARAVDFIHTKKIVHRDLKPENIYATQDGKVKLMDFGIAKSEGVNLTRAGFTVGTPYYMAPEQVIGEAVTRQADVYTFGVLLFELLTGARPVKGDTMAAIFDQILHEPLNLEPIQALNLPPSVSDLLVRCSAKQPAQRPEGLGVVCQEIERILAESGPPAVPLGLQMSTTIPMPAPKRPTQVPRGGLPAFLQKLPSALRTESGLMLLAATAVVVVVMSIYAVLAVAHVI